MVAKVRSVSICIKDLKTSCQGMLGVMAAPIADNIDVNIPYLVPAPSAVSKKHHCLTRGQVIGLLSKEAVREVNKKADEARTTESKNRRRQEQNVAQVAVDSQLTGPKHLRL